MKQTIALVSLASASFFFGCEGDVNQSGGCAQGGDEQGGDGQGGSAQGGSAQGGAAQGGGGVGGDAYDLSECDSDGDCPGSTCIDLHGGYRVCQYPVIEATGCSSPDDGCCTTSDCGTGEKCLETPLTSFCAGIQPQPINVCAADSCGMAGDCGTDEFCAPAGTVGNKIAVCMKAACSGVCGQESLSPCALVREPCCSTPIGFMCIPNDGCQSNADCAMGYCEAGTCTDGSPICPA
jgi:hypothetical protein